MNIQDNQSKEYKGKWGAMVAVGLGIFMGSLDMSIINISLPTLMKELNAQFATVQWIVIGYTLLITCTMLGAARMGDIYNKKKLINWGLTIFTLGSFLCAFSPNVHWLIAFRIFQGLGAVIMQALGMAIIVEIFPSSERGKALGIMSSIVSVGISLGPPLGGLIIGMLGWPWIFLLNVPFGMIALAASFKFLPRIAPRHSNQSFDMVGALIMFITLGSFALGMTLGQNRGFGNHIVQVLLIIAAVFILIFLFVEKRVRQPMVDMTLFGNIEFNLHLMMGFFSFITLAGVFIMPFYLQLVKHYTPQQIGFIMMITPITLGSISLISGTLSDRFGTHKLSMIGLLIIAFGCWSISTLNADVGVAGYLLRMFPLGLGLGTFQSPNNSAIMGAAPRDRLGVASGLLALSRNLGQTAGMPIMGAVFMYAVMASTNMSTFVGIDKAPPEALVNGLTATYRLGSIFLLSTTLLTIIILWFDKKRVRRNGS